MKSLTIATRSSRLALWQAEHIAAQIRELKPALRIRLLTVKTKGDVMLDSPLAKIGGKGLFVREIEEALLSGQADLAVHSMKDLPSELPAGLVVSTVTKREDPADIFLSQKFTGLHALPPGSVVGTSSLRRQAQVLFLRPDIVVKPLRGNVDTRLSKLTEGLYDAIILASAGINRLALSAPSMMRIDPADLLPAPGQGALGVECLSVRKDLAALLKSLDDGPTRLCVEAERAFSRQVGGSCQVPAGALARYENGSIYLDAILAEPDGSRVVRRLASGSASDAAKIGEDLAITLKKNGGTSILQTLGL